MNVFWNELADVAGLQREIDRLFGGRRWSTAPRNGQTPEVVQGQDEENLYVEMVLPGVNPETLDLSVEDNVLRVSGARNEPNQATDNIQWRLNERPGGEFTHRLRLPLAIDVKKVTADYVHGILKVTLPKAAAAKARKIKVKVA